MKRALVGVTLAILTGCARSGHRGPPTETIPARPSETATAVFRLDVSIDGRRRSPPAKAIHLLRTDSIPSSGPAGETPNARPHVRRLDEEGWYAVDLPPGRYHLNVVSKWHFPTPRALPPLVLEIRTGDDVAFAGSIEMNCFDRLAPDHAATWLYDCERPTIRTGDAATAARRAGRAKAAATARPARPLATLTSPDIAGRDGPWVLHHGHDGGPDIPLHPLPHLDQAGERTALAGGVALVTSISCGPMFAFCAAVLAPPVVLEAAVDARVERYGNRVRAACNERLVDELRDFDAEHRLRRALRARFAAAGRPLANEADASGDPPPAVALDVAVLRIGVRGDTCLPAFNPFKLPDRYRADILARVRAFDGQTGAMLYEEFLTNADALSSWEIVAGHSSLTPVGGSAACRRVREFCPDDGRDVLVGDLDPSIQAFADHVVRALDLAARASAPRR